MKLSTLIAGGLLAAFSFLSHAATEVTATNGRCAPGAAGTFTCTTTVTVRVLPDAPAPEPVTGAAFYFADCQAGAASACVPGNNANAGSDPAKPKRNLDGFKWPTGPGNAVRFARGGSFTGVYIDAPAGSTAENPTRIEAYVPAWCDEACWMVRPILKARANAKGAGDDLLRFWFKRGFMVRDLELRGYGDANGYGVMSAGSSDIQLRNLHISGFAIGVHATYGYNGTPAARVTLADSTIERNRVQGFLGGVDDMLIDGNTFDRNGSDNGTRDHNIYLSGGAFGVKGVTVRGNVLTGNAQFQESVAAIKECRSVSLVGHGSIHDLTIEGNTITETASRAVCWGIAINGVTGSDVPQQFPGLRIVGNTVTIGGLGNVGITCNSCPGAVIEGNTVTRTGKGGSFAAIHVPTMAADLKRGDLADGDAVIRNNVISVPAGVKQ